MAANVIRSIPTSSLLEDIKGAYVCDADAKALLDYLCDPSSSTMKGLAPYLRARCHRYTVRDGVLMYYTSDDDTLRIRCF